MIAAGLDMYLSFYDAPLATLEQIARVHPAEYIRSIGDSAPESGVVHLDPDTAMSPGTWPAALRSAGAGILATDLVMAGEAENAFCSIRPPGHHAERARAMGFCFFNNIAIAAAHALEAHGLARVAVADFDVHHGNGTENIFANDPRVLMVSTFQHPFYPYSGTEHPAANMCNVPVKAGMRGEGFREVVTDVWLPRLREFAPELFIILGPGTTLGGAVAQALILADWKGMGDKATFQQQQGQTPLLAAMGNLEQRPWVTTNP